jgi:molybdenum cofactor biosynthesis enzyme MoaA
MFEHFDMLDGFNEIESDLLGPFVWTQGTFRLRLKRDACFAVAELCYNGVQGTVSMSSERRPVAKLSIDSGWGSYPVRLVGQAGDLFDCEVSPVIAVAGDTRQLGVMLRQIEVIDDAERFEMMGETLRNLRTNEREYLEGRTILESLPPQLRINMEVRCNIPETGPACVYCAWDWAKVRERGSPAFELDTLAQLGDFYRCAQKINDCSIGEPTMHKDFGAIVARLNRDGKPFSLTSNGQLLGAKRRHELLGKDVELYVSIDSATAEGYERYRNKRFTEIINNLRVLCREKKAHGDLPRVFVSLIAMRSNAEELPEFFALMREIGVDAVKVRSLYLDENLHVDALNGGYRFSYPDEIVRTTEQAILFPHIRELARENELPVYIESEDTEILSTPAGAPLCDEPWKTLYILRRGIMPCCYAAEPIATWDQQQDRPLDEFLREVFNGPAYRELRTELAAGRLPDFCMNTPSCPIVQRHREQGLIDAPANALEQRKVEAPPGQAPLVLPMVPLENLTAGANARAA